MNNRHANELMHHGIMGMHWGIRRFQPYPSDYNGQGKYVGKDTVFVSGSSKTQDKKSGYYRRKLPKGVRQDIDENIKAGNKFVVGDAPGVDRQVQKYLKKKHYKNVEVYGPGKQVRYSADKRWKTNAVDVPDAEPGSKEWLAAKDKAMQDISTKGIAVILDEGASATRKNIKALIEKNKDVKVYELGKGGEDKNVTYDWNPKKYNYKALLPSENEARRFMALEIDANPIIKGRSQAFKDTVINNTINRYGKMINDIDPDTAQQMADIGMQYINRLLSYTNTK